MGACVALQLAAEQRCDAVVCINPVAADPDAIESLVWRKHHGQLWIDVAPSTVEEIAYESLPIDSLIAMAEGVATIDLTAIDQPVLLVTSADDDVVDPASSDVVAAALRGNVQRLHLRHGGHVATLGTQRHLVQRAVVEFVSGSRGSRPTRDR
jgi:esterase/lipase